MEQETKFEAAYNLTELPEWMPHDTTEVAPGEPPRWSGTGELSAPPALGSAVVIRMNRIGPAEVTGYFFQGGFLGVYATPHEPPDWWLKQMAGASGRRDAMVFGAELGPRALASYVLEAADDIKKLRKPDVFRVLEAAKEGSDLAEVAWYIRHHRRDLEEEVQDCIADLQPEG